MIASTQVETIVNMPVINPASNCPSRTFCYMGVVDRVEGGKVIDWKTVADPSRFIAQRRIGFQAELYALALGKQGVEVREIEYRLVTRPTIRLCGKDKTPADYEDRCVEWLTQPGKLVSHPYTITTSKLEQAKWYLWECSKRILDSRKNVRWIPNTGACFAYERECQFMGLCDAVQNGADPEWLIEDGFRVRETSHPELNSVDETATLEVLTYSSLSDLSQCEMFYHWKHERRLAKGQEDSEALYIGSAMHRGMEVLATADLNAALEAIDAWAADNPTLGPDDTHKQSQNVARARAMVRVAGKMWSVERSG